MTTDLIVVTEPFKALVEECKAIITETIFTSRWALVEGYHQLGERIQTDEGFQKYAKDNKSSVQGLAKNIGISERTLYYAMQFYDKYPKLDEVPEGKNISWNKVITKYLPKVAREAKEKPSYTDLHNIIKSIKDLLKVEHAKATQEQDAGRCGYIRYLQDQVVKITEGLL